MEREREGGGLNLKMKVILHSILLYFFCLFIGPSLFSFKLIFRLDLAGFYHSRANRIGRLWIFKIGPLLDYRLIACIVKKVTNEVLESFF